MNMNIGKQFIRVIDFLWKNEYWKFFVSLVIYFIQYLILYYSLTRKTFK